MRCDNAGMRNKWLQDRLRELHQHRKSQRGLAQALGLAPARVSEIIQGTRRLQVEELDRVATYLEWPRARVEAYYAAGGELVANSLDAGQIGSLMVVGVVQAGVWREALEWAPEDWRPAPIAPDSRFPRQRQFGLEVRGPSMNEEYPEGSVVICVRLFELGRDPVHGEHVICQRRSSEGVETTIKELRRGDDGSFWLWPRSSDPNFQAPWHLAPPRQDDDNDDVRIVALVVGSYKPRPMPLFITGS